MPNLRGASPICRDGEDRSYATQTVDRGRPNRQRCSHGRVLSKVVMMTVQAGRTCKSHGRAGRARGARPCGRVGRGWEGVRGAAESARGRGREGDDTIYAVAKNIETSVKKKI